MDFNILETYRIFAVIGFIIIVIEVLFICNKKRNVAYCGSLFWLSSFLWVLETTIFILGDLFGKPDGLNDIGSKGVLFILYIFLFIQGCTTVLLYLFLGKYAEYHIVYNPKKKRKPLTVNFEESYIVVYGLSKFKKKIYIRDIVVEKSYFVSEYKPSKLFPYAAIIGTKEYMIAKLTNGKSVKISNSPFFIFGDTLSLITLSKTLKIEFIDTPKPIKKYK